MSDQLCNLHVLFIRFLIIYLRVRILILFINLYGHVLAVNKHVQLHEDIKIKFLQEVKEKKELYNKVLELKGKKSNDF